MAGRAFRRVVALLVGTWLLLQPPARASGIAAISLQVPEDAVDVHLEVREGVSGRPVALTNDGSLALDAPGDREWWTVLELKGARSHLVVTGTVDGEDVGAAAQVELQAGGGRALHPVAYDLRSEEGAWKLEPRTPPGLPVPSDRSALRPLALLLVLLGFGAPLVLGARRRRVG